MEVDLDPARSRGHILTMIFGPPTFDKGHAYRTHLCQLIDSFETMIDALRQQLRELPVIEDLQRAIRRYLTHRRRVEAVVVIAVSTLDENRRV